MRKLSERTTLLLKPLTGLSFRKKYNPLEAFSFNENQQQKQVHPKVGGACPSIASGGELTQKTVSIRLETKIPLKGSGVNPQAIGNTGVVAGFFYHTQ